MQLPLHRAPRCRARTRRGSNALCPPDEREGGFGPALIGSSPRGAPTYGRLIELRDLFHAMSGELDSPSHAIAV